MKHLVKDALKLLVASAAVIVATGWVGTTRADIAYSYAEQTLTGISVTGTGLAGAVMNGTTTSASAVINGVGVATNNPTDTPEAYIGAAPPAPQNFFQKYSTQGGGSQAGDFSRGDALITGTSIFTGAGMNASNVAESVLNSVNTPTGLATGNGSWSLAGSFTAPTTSTITVAYSYLNDILDAVTGAGASAQSSFKVTISIKDQHGREVDATPTELNTALSAPPNGPELVTSGTSSAALSLATLTAGDIYAISISGTELSSAQLAPAVPEPGSFALAGMGGALALAFHAFRRRTRKV